MDPALRSVVERTGPSWLAGTSCQAWKEAANRRADYCRAVTGLGEGDLSSRTPREQSALDWIAAANEGRSGLDRGRTEPKQRRARSQQPQLDRTLSVPGLHKAPGDSLDLTPVHAAQALPTGDGKLDHGRTESDALLRLDRTVVPLALPR